MLQNAGVAFSVMPARIDEDSIKDSLLAEDASPHDIADALAEFKARKISHAQPDAFVIGSDQVIAWKGRILSKPTSQEDCIQQLRDMRGTQHSLFSAAVIYQGGEPKWRHVGRARILMREATDGFLEAYVDRNWEEIQHCVGGYQIEAEGIRLFARVEGSYFTVLGMPLLELLTYLTQTGAIDG